MNSNVVSIFKDGRAPRASLTPRQPESTRAERPGLPGSDETDHRMIDLYGLSEEEWDEVFGGSFIIF